MSNEQTKRDELEAKATALAEAWCMEDNEKMRHRLTYAYRAGYLKRCTDGRIEELWNTGDHVKELHNFVNSVAKFAEDPCSWPLTQEEQVHCIRAVIFRALRIRKTQAFAEVETRIQAENLAMAS